MHQIGCFCQYLIFVDILIIMWNIISFIQLMEERASLKSYGRFQCNGSYMFYQLVLTEKQYLIRYYNEKGKLKLMRPIKIPSEEVQFHTAGSYLLCYVHSPSQASQSEIMLIKLDSCRKVDLKCQCHLPCKGQQRKAINHVYFNSKKQVIIFSDDDQNIHLLDVGTKDMKCTKICENDKVITRIQMDFNDRIAFVTQDRRLTSLKMNWNEIFVLEKQVKNGFSDFYCENCFQISFSNKQSQLPQKANRDENDELQIRIQGLDRPEYSYWLQRSAQLIIFSSSDCFLVIFCPKLNIFLSLIQGIFKIYGADKPASIPKHLKNNNYLISYKKDIHKKVRVELIVYDQLNGQFTTQHYYYSDLGKNVNLAFVKKNIENIYCFNGLIDPVHESVVRQGLKQLQLMEGDFQKSKSINEKEDFSETSVELANKLLCKGLYSFPKQMMKIVQRLKAQIMNNKNIYWVLETKRFFEHCQKINSDIANDFQQIAESIEKASLKEQVKSSSDLYQKNTKVLEEHSCLLQNMINFLFMMSKELNGESKNVKLEKLSSGQDQQASVIVSQLKYNKKVLQSSKSLFAIGKLLQDEEIVKKYDVMMSYFQKTKRQLQYLWKEKYPQKMEMDYSPNLIYQHFSAFEQLPENTLTFVQFIQTLLSSKERFLWIAYFYAAINKSRTVPFVDSDVNELVQNIITQVEPLPELKKEESMEQQVINKDLLHKMTGTVLKLNQLSFTKYLIQLSVYHKQNSLAVMLIHSVDLSLSSEERNINEDHFFMMKSLLLGGNFELAYLYTLRNYSEQLFSNFLRFVKIGGHLQELIQFKLDKKLLENDDSQLISQLDLEKEQQNQLQKMLNKLQSL